VSRRLLESLRLPTTAIRQPSPAWYVALSHTRAASLRFDKEKESPGAIAFVRVTKARFVDVEALELQTLA